MPRTLIPQPRQIVGRAISSNRAWRYSPQVPGAPTRSSSDSITFGTSVTGTGGTGGGSLPAIYGFGTNALSTLGSESYVVSSTATGTGAGTWGGAMAWLNAGHQGTVTFSVSGTIALPLSIQYLSGLSNFLVDGRGQSITFTGGTIWMEGSHHFAFVNVRHRGGWSDGQNADNFTNAGSAHDFAYLNVSVSNAYDEGISSTRNSYNYTIQDCLFGIGADGQAGDPRNFAHNYGSLNYGGPDDRNGPGTFLRNVWISKDYRNPKLAYRGDTSTSPDATAASPNTIDYDCINNITADCEWATTVEQGAKANVINQYDHGTANTGIQNWQGGLGYASDHYAVPSWARAGITILSPTAARDYGKDNAGCLPRDSFDTTILGQLV